MIHHEAAYPSSSWAGAGFHSLQRFNKTVLNKKRSFEITTTRFLSLKRFYTSNQPPAQYLNS